MEENNKRVLCYYIVSYIGGLIALDMSLMTDDDVLESVERLEQLPYERLLSMYDLLSDLFIEKFGFEEE